MKLTITAACFAAALHERAAAAPAVGVTADPCDGVPTAPTPAHQAAADPYAAWMHDWLSLDWGQQCRYRADNAALPAAGPRRVVFFGDSITEGWNSADPGIFGRDVLDRGISGQTTAQMLVRLRADVIDLHPAVVHLMAGTNDIAGNTGPTSLAAIQGNIASMVELAQHNGVRVVLASIPPAAKFPWRPSIAPAATIVAMNAWLRDYATHHRCVYVDYHRVLTDGHDGFDAKLSDDGVHPNAAGFARMRPLADEALRAAFAKR